MVSVASSVPTGGIFLLNFFKPFYVNSGLKCKCDPHREILETQHLKHCKKRMRNAVAYPGFYRRGRQLLRSANIVSDSFSPKLNDNEKILVQKGRGDTSLGSPRPSTDHPRDGVTFSVITVLFVNVSKCGVVNSLWLVINIKQLAIVNLPLPIWIDYHY